MQKEVSISVSRHVNQPYVYRVTVTRDGEEIGVATGGFTKETKIRTAIRDNFRNTVMTKDVQAAIDAFVAAGRPKGETVTHKAHVAATATTTSPGSEKPIFERRALTATRDQAEKFDTLAEAISRPMSPGVEEIVSWSKAHRSVACCVDIDWHGGTVPSRDASNQPIIDQIERAKPVPAYGWVTKHRGIRLVYTGDHADLRAAIAAVEIVSRLWGAREFRPTAVELKCDTRVAPVGHRVIHFIEEQKLIVPRGADGFDDSFDHEDWVTYLEDVGMVIGQRYPHDKCLVHPEHASKSQRPVEVRNNCVICHSCQGNGIKGYIRYASSILRSDSIDTANDMDIMKMVKNCTHYEHAQYVLKSVVPPIIRDEHLKLYYRALLVRYHGDDDPRIERVFYKYDMLRLNGVWGTSQGYARDKQLTKAAAASLPVAKDSSGGSIAAIAERLRDAAPLNDYGYPSLRPVFGMRVGTFHQPAADGVPRIVVSPNGVVPPTYIDEKTRKTSGKSRDWAWETLDTVWPGITREYIEMLIISRGLVERGEISLTPMFWLNDTKGAGKTASIFIAAGMLGDACSVLKATSDSTENYKEVLYAMDKGSFVLYDEIGKAANNTRRPKTFFDFLLALSPGLMAKRLYAGPVPLGWLPVISLADTDWPEGFENDGQLGRRLLRVNLKPVTQEWRVTASAVGIYDFRNPRRVTEGYEDIPLACDVVVSCIIDEYFGGTIAPLAETAAKLGIKYMIEGGKHADRMHVLRDFFEAWREHKSDDLGNGFKAFDVSDSSPLALMWDKVRDPEDRFKFSDANAESWQRVTGHSCRLEMLPVKRIPHMPNRIAVSFVQGDDRDNMKPVYVGGV